MGSRFAWALRAWCKSPDHLAVGGEQSGSFFRLGITDTCEPRKTYSSPAAFLGTLLIG